MRVEAGFRDSPERALPEGDLVGLTYAVGRELARTETGVVYEAHDRLLDRLVALKIAWRDAGTPSLIVEARRCAAVRDPCSVQIHGMGAHRGVEYALAERVVGRLLGEELDKPMSGDLYLARLRTLVAAVVRAHEAGIAVGDISGSTVLVVPDQPGEAESVRPEGRLVLGRLSLSQVPAFGRHGQILVPEVARGEAQASDPAAAEAIDLYGLGCVAIEMASGEPPFADPNVDRELEAHARTPPPRIVDLRPDLPVELSDLVDWLLAKYPIARPRSARDVLAQLDAIIGRLGSANRTLRVLIVDADAARARWLWGLARRAHAATIVETASEGGDAAHKLNRDQPDLVFVDVALRGVMNALELCMYARGLESWHHHLGQLFIIGDVSASDAQLLDEFDVQTIPDDANLPGVILDLLRAAVSSRTRARYTPPVTVSG